MLAVAVLAGPGGPGGGRADAQGSERTSPHLRNDCRLAAQILTLGRAEPRRDWALQRITACDETGGPALAALWTAPPPPDVAELERLYWSSAGLVDARLLAAVRTAASATSNPTVVRLAALRVLAAYVDPHLDPTIQDLTPPSGGERGGQFAQLIGSVDHRVQTVGELPAAGYHASILTVLAELAASDPDATVRYAAGRLRDALSS